MSYRVYLASRAQRELQNLPKADITRIDKQITLLAESPRHADCKKLRGKTPEGYRVRVDDYRILYRIDDDDRRVLIYRIGHRRDIYR